MSDTIKIKGRLYSVTPVTNPVAAPPAAGTAKQRITQRQFDKKVEEMLLFAASLNVTVTKADAEVAVAKQYEVKPHSSISVPVNRTNAVGGICPKLGEPGHWQGSDKSPDPQVQAGLCGKNNDGHFASAKGFAYHQSIYVKP